VHWVQQAEACVAPRLFIIAARGNLPEVLWSNPGQGNGPYWVKAGMAETGAANINTRSGQSIRDAGA
jgi:hypothetical protein